VEQYRRDRESLAVKFGKKLRKPINRFFARQSLIETGPFIDPAHVPGISILQENWETIRDEALAVLEDRESIPPLGRISPDHRRIAQSSAWKSFFFNGYGYKSPANRARCPTTAALIDKVPDANVAFYSIFEPGTHVKAHHGVTKAMLNIHLGLIVPDSSARCELRVGDHFRGWTPGEFLIFDETYNHEAWNDGDIPRVVLFLQVMRPMRWPGRLLARIWLWCVGRTSYVQDARKAIGAG